jgi:outer membrane protein assembly factor BamA
MLVSKKIWLCVLGISLFTIQAAGQNSPQAADIPNSESSGFSTPEQPLIFIIREISISGNKKTRSEIIFRELPFKTGDPFPLQALVEKFELAKQRLMNTALFDEVSVSTKKIEGNYVDIIIDVNERWYIYPLPILKPVGRNINDWLFEQKANLDRVNYGIKLTYNNATGFNDKLRLNFINGYTKQFSFSYDRPYIDKNLRWGLKIGFATGKNREINYNTVADKQVFLKDNDQYIRDFTWASIGFTYRKAIKTRHQLGFNFFNERVNDTVVALNPAYFKNGRHSVSFPELYYTFSFIDLDYNPYPTKGYATEISFYRKGVNKYINSWQLTAHVLGSWPITAKTFFSIRGYGSIKLPFRQPYFNLRFLGFGNAFMQGYEYYVIDGVAGGYLKPTLTRELFAFKLKLPQGKYNSIENFPVRIFGKIYGNAGYVYNPQPGDNYLSNTLLFSGGAGIDILTLSDFTIKLEWTMNRSGQNGLFLHNKSMF